MTGNSFDRAQHHPFHGAVRCPAPRDVQRCPHCRAALLWTPMPHPRRQGLSFAAKATISATVFGFAMASMLALFAYGLGMAF